MFVRGLCKILLHVWNELFEVESGGCGLVLEVCREVGGVTHMARGSEREAAG